MSVMGTGPQLGLSPPAPGERGRPPPLEGRQPGPGIAQLPVLIHESLGLAWHSTQPRKEGKQRGSTLASLCLHPLGHIQTHRDQCSPGVPQVQGRERCLPHLLGKLNCGLLQPRGSTPQQSSSGQWERVEDKARGEAGQDWSGSKGLWGEAEDNALLQDHCQGQEWGMWGHPLPHNGGSSCSKPLERMGGREAVEAMSSARCQGPECVLRWHGVG